MALIARLLNVTGLISDYQGLYALVFGAVMLSPFCFALLYLAIHRMLDKQKARGPS